MSGYLTDWHLVDPRRVIDPDSISKKLFGTATRLDPTDLILVIFTLCVTDPDPESGKTVSESFTSFNNGQPENGVRDFLKKEMPRITTDLKSQLAKTVVSAKMSFADKTKRTSAFVVTASRKFVNVSFEKRKNLLLWFNQHGNKMFGKYLLSTGRVISYKSIDMDGYKYANTADIVWRFPFDASEVVSFLQYVDTNLPHYTLVKYGASPDDRNMYREDVKYFWTPREFNPGQIFKSCSGLYKRIYGCFINLRLFFDRLMSMGIIPNIPPELIGHIISFIPKESIRMPQNSADFINDLIGNRLKLKVSARNFVEAALAISPIVFGEPYESGDQICGKDESKIATRRDFKLRSTGKRFILIGDQT